MPKKAKPMAVVFEGVAVNVAAKKGRPAKKGKGKAKDTPAVPAVPAHTKLVRRYAWKELAKCLNPAATQEILFWVDYAASGRAKCQKCGEAIAKGSVRVATPKKFSSGDHGYVSSYHHMACVRAEEKSAKLLAPKVFGLDATAQWDVAGGGQTMAGSAVDGLKKEDRAAVLKELTKAEPVQLEAIDPNAADFLKLERFNDLPRRKAPDTFKGKLLPFQERGLGWMIK